MPGRLSVIGRGLQVRLKGFFESPPDAAAHPLEILQAVLDELERKVQPVGRGGKVFPYNRITVRVAAHADRAALEAVFQELDARLRERLEELRCEAPKSIDLKVVCLKKASAEWSSGQVFSTDCRSEADAAPPQDDAPRKASLRVTVVKGAAAQKEYTFTEPVVSIGRTSEPADGMGRVRRNHVAFLETVDGVTETVGRAHARILRDDRTREYRLFHEATSNATFLVRDGATIEVLPRDPRGVRLRSGDEVQLGRAVIRLAINQS